MHDNLMYCICTAYFKRHAFVGSYGGSLFLSCHAHLVVLLCLCVSIMLNMESLRDSFTSKKHSNLRKVK